MKCPIFCIGFALLIFYVPAAEAQNRNPSRAVEKNDKNGDGRVSPDEWSRSPAIFERIDKDGDGFLTADDFTAFWAERSAKGENARKKMRKKRTRQSGQQGGQNSGKTVSKQDLDVIGVKLLGIWKDAIKQRDFASSAIVLVHRGQFVAQEGIRVTAKTPMSVASISKSFTGACAYLAIKQGLLAENTTLGDIFGARLEGIGVDNTAQADVNVGGLLSQTAGIGPDRTQGGAYSNFIGTSDSQDKRIARIALRAPPRERGKYYYTKENFSIFAEALEALSGKAYQSYCKEVVFQPIGATSAQLSDYWGFYASGGGWQISTLDLAKFALRYANPRQGLGAELPQFASGTVKGSLKYSMGMFYNQSAQGVGRIYHSGHLRNGSGRQDGGFFFSARNGWTIALTATRLSTDDMKKLQSALMKTALGKG